MFVSATPKCENVLVARTEDGEDKGKRQTFREKCAGGEMGTARVRNPGHASTDSRQFSTVTEISGEVLHLLLLGCFPVSSFLQVLGKGVVSLFVFLQVSRCAVAG